MGVIILQTCFAHDSIFIIFLFVLFVLFILIVSCFFFPHLTLLRLNIWNMIFPHTTALPPLPTDLQLPRTLVRELSVFLMEFTTQEIVTLSADLIPVMFPYIKHPDLFISLSGLQALILVCFIPFDLFSVCFMLFLGFFTPFPRSINRTNNSPTIPQ